MVNVWNRSGNTSAGQGAMSFFHQTRMVLGDTFKITRVLCDSGFYEIAFIRYLESQNFTYSISVPISLTIQRDILKVKQWHTLSKGIEAGEFYFQHYDATWTKPRRYVVVRQAISRRPKALGKQPTLFKDLIDWSQYRISVMITNDLLSPEEIWRAYRPRANDENVIKDLKEGYSFETFNVNNFWATEAVLTMIALVFHNLIVYLNRTILNHNQSQEQLKTLRHKYFTLPGQLGSGGRNYVLRLNLLTAPGP
ncbi:MAG: transposase [Thermodesulfobacteriota bacterium]